jgi:parallel beta-helix repeat protein
LLILILLLAGITGVATGTSRSLSSAQETYDVKPTCEDSLQDLIDESGPDSKVKARTDCIYREDLVIFSPLVLDGQGEAEIRGSDIWTDWTEVDGLWVSNGVVPVFPIHGSCYRFSDDRCLLPEQVFYNGVPLQQLPHGSVPGSGEFALDSSRRIVLADEPGDAVVEVTMRERWVSIGADGVTVRGFTMKHAAVDSQNGALSVIDVSDWTVANNTMSDAHGVIVRFENAPGGVLLENELFNGGQLGLSGSGGEVRVEGNAIHHNNTEAFATGWEAGGMKITWANDVTIDGNNVYLNNGPGIWCDLNCFNMTFSNNNVHHNLGVGIMFEISDGAEIFGNTVWENGWGVNQTGWAYNAGILIASSRNANVYDNLVAWNGDGITVISQCRAYLDDERTCDVEHEWNQVHGNEVHDNVIVLGEHTVGTENSFALGWLRDLRDEDGEPYLYMFEPEAGNTGYDNRYWLPDQGNGVQIVFTWNGRDFLDLDDFNSTPGEQDGEFIDEDERDRILDDAGVPLEPEEHTERIPLVSPLSPVSSDVPGAVIQAVHHTRRSYRFQ